MPMRVTTIWMVTCRRRPVSWYCFACQDDISGLVCNRHCRSPCCWPHFLLLDLRLRLCLLWLLARFPASFWRPVLLPIPGACKSWTSCSQPYLVDFCGLHWGFWPWPFAVLGITRKKRTTKMLRKELACRNASMMILMEHDILYTIIVPDECLQQGLLQLLGWTRIVLCCVGWFFV